MAPPRAASWWPSRASWICPSATSGWAKRPRICCRSMPKSLSSPSLNNEPGTMDAGTVNPACMREALELARKGRALASPNPMVGAVLERDGQVVGRGFHTYAGLHHAEIMALAQAGAAARGSTLYLNLEPCSHHGRTPPCVHALIEAGVARVVAPIQDPNPLVAGDGFRQLRAAGIEVEMVSDFAAEAEKLNEPFLH